MAKNKITKKTLILEVVERYPKAVDVLVEKYNFHCIGCSLAEMENLEEGASAHGMSKKEIEEMVVELNKIVADEP